MRNESVAISAKGPREAAPAPEVLPITHNMIQAELALLLYKRDHAETGINLADPMQTPKQIRDAAMAGWLNGGYATAFSKYRDDHTDIQVKSGDEVELAKLLSAAEDTLH